jgi:predicted outer membrane repeat protein
VWSEVTLVIEGGVAARTYENCALDSTLSGNIGLRDGGFSALGQGNLAGRWYQGEVDEVRVWSRALPDEEIALLCQRNSICEGPVYVDVDAPAGGDGFAWSSAFNDVQTALDAAASCTAPQLWVAEGQYAPNPAQSVATITRSVEIYGGFAGTEAALSQRDVVAHPTRLGGDAWLARVVAINGGYTNVRLDGFAIVNSDKGAIDIDTASGSAVVLANLTITDNATDKGAAVYAHGSSATLTIRDSTFERNTVTGSGGALFVTGTPTQISGSSFVDNVSKQGGALYLSEPAASHQIIDSEFTSNTADWGGAIHLNDDPLTPAWIELAMQGGEIVENVGNSGGGGVYLEESTCSFDGVAFVDNQGWTAGGIYLGNASVNVVNDTLEITGCRFIGNHTVNGSGGGLRLQEVGTSVVNTEFVANTATTVGGGVYGRANFVGATFANNTAPTAGAALYAPAGAEMTMQHCVVYPDSIWGSNIQAPYSCTKTNTLLGAPQTLLANQTPFAAADLDLDGRTEWYLDPAGPCTGLADGAIDEFEWASLTVDASQCTDAGWPEPGVHYEPQSAAGVCE